MAGVGQRGGDRRCMSGATEGNRRYGNKAGIIAGHCTRIYLRMSWGNADLIPLTDDDASSVFPAGRGSSSAPGHRRQQPVAPPQLSGNNHEPGAWPLSGATSEIFDLTVQSSCEGGAAISANI